VGPFRDWLQGDNSTSSLTDLASQFGLSWGTKSSRIAYVVIGMGLLNEEMDQPGFHLFELLWGAAGLAAYHGLCCVAGLFSLSGRSTEFATRVVGVPFAVVFLFAAVQRLNDIGWSRWLAGPLAVLGCVALLPRELWVWSKAATPISLVALFGGLVWLILSMHRGR
jgi:hypothetical protein